MPYTHDTSILLGLELKIFQLELDQKLLEIKEIAVKFTSLRSCLKKIKNYTKSPKIH
jgi:hypothetical protein